MKNILKKIILMTLSIILTSASLSLAQEQSLTWISKPQDIDSYDYSKETGLRTYGYKSEEYGNVWLNLDKNLNIITPTLEGYSDFMPINSEYTIVSKDFSYETERWDSAVIDNNKNFVIPHGKYTTIKYFNSSSIIVEKDKKYGIIDITEKEIIPFEYDFITPFDDKFMLVGKDSKKGVIDILGNEIIPCGHILGDSYKYYDDQFFVVEAGDKSSAEIFDIKGNLIKSISQFNSIDYIKGTGFEIHFSSSANDTKFLFPDGSFFDLKDYASTHYLTSAHDDYFVLTKNATNERIVTDKNLNVLLSLKGTVDYEGNGIFALSEYDFSASKKTILGYYEADGTDVTDKFKEFEDFWYLDENLFYARKGDSIGVIDKNANTMISFIDISALEKVDDNLYIVYTKGGLGFAELNGSGEKVGEWKDGIVLKIGSTNAKVDGESKECDAAPIIRNGRTMLPARFVAENLGAKVEWNAEKREVIITSTDTTIVLTIDSDKAMVNSSLETLDSPAFIENGRTYTPVRFVAEKLGAKVFWEAETQSVQIVK